MSRITLGESAALLMKDRTCPQSLQQRSAVSAQSRGYGFVHMSNEESAKAAADGMHGKTIDGRVIVARLRSSGKHSSWF